MKQWTGALRSWLVHDGPSPRVMRVSVITSVIVLVAASAAFIVIGVREHIAPATPAAIVAGPKSRPQARPHTVATTTVPKHALPHAAHLHPLHAPTTPHPAHAPQTLAKAVVTAPTAVTATPSGDTLTVAWAPSPPGSTLPVQGYNVYLGTSPAGQPVVPANGTTPVPGTSFVSHGLTLGITYYATVKAVSGTQLSPASNKASAVAGSGYPPTGVLATPVVGMAAQPDGGGTGSSTIRGRFPPTVPLRTSAPRLPANRWHRSSGSPPRRLEGATGRWPGTGSVRLR